MNTCRVSVIVPACNASSYLDRCLGALLAGQGDGYEIIVVDDCSVDATPAIAERLGVEVIRLNSNSGPSRARNTGARRARGEYLLFVDSDVVVRPGTIPHIREFLDANPGVASVFGSYDTEPAAKGIVTEYRNLLHHYTHQQGRREASTFWAGCGAIRREVFLAVGGFDEVSHPRCIEDIELGYRLRAAGHQIVLDHELLCKHMKRWTVPSMVKTDILGRAIPWARLMIGRKTAPDDLNIKRAQKLCVLLMGLALLSIPAVLLTPWSLAVGAAALLLIVALNAPLFRFLVERRSVLFAIACIPLQFLYYLYSGLSYAYVRLFMALGLRVRDGNV
ncbi:MAG: glycosyltransferase family 2 protein [Acidobacteria bacterium]|nr:glycosyltransferase family 2 protein [Acidobacteriota bacterium]